MSDVIDNLEDLEKEVVRRIKSSGKTYAELDRDSRVPQSTIRSYALTGKIDSKTNLFKLVSYFRISYILKG
ncbi:MAG: hypothetical protein KDK45_23515 [Leptospiraceae bacterium]|nr:hypothetical protein [Leptospiraceae bacterium]